MHNVRARSACVGLVIHGHMIIVLKVELAQINQVQSDPAYVSYVKVNSNYI